MVIFNFRDFMILGMWLYSKVSLSLIWGRRLIGVGFFRVLGGLFIIICVYFLIIRKVF